MARHSRLCALAFLALLAVTSAANQRWSRQISSYTSDLSDWVPLPGPIERELPPIKRQAVAEPRILSEPVYPGFGRPTGFSQDAFPSRTYFNGPSNRQLYLQSVPAVPSAPQNYLTDQGFGQNIRFGLSQPNFPLNQAFVSQQFPFENMPQRPVRPAPANPIKFESFPNANLPSLSPQAKPFNNQGPRKLDAPKFVDGYRVENSSNDFSAVPKKRPQSLQKLKFDSLEKLPRTEMVPPVRPKSEREEVQLLYVPVESLNRGQFNFRNPLTSSQLLNTEPHPQFLQRPKQAFPGDFQRPIPKPIDSFETEQEFLSKFNSYKELDQVPKFSTLSSPFPTSPQTTPKPKKLRPHQPPLAIFMIQDARKGSQVKVGDVLSSLKNAESVAVLDAVNPLTAPKVFIGPSTLNPPDNFVKFELPYLSNIEHSDKKLRQLPFFVAPLSYNTPQGFAKIPFPSPHVGSVVINSQIKESTTTVTPSTPIDVIPNSYSTSPQTYRETKPSTQKPSVSYYSTIPPRTNAPQNYQSDYYSFEPQTVSTIRPSQSLQGNQANSQKPGSYFLSNFDQYNPSQFRFEDQNDFKTPEPVKDYKIGKLPETPSTPKSVVSTTASKISTYPSQLLETHNPYSINQAFHFSTPVDYHSFFDESYATPGSGQPPTSLSLPVAPSSGPTPKPTEAVTEKPNHQSSPSYLQNYSPEIHYGTEVQNTRYTDFNPNGYTAKPEVTSDYNPSVSNSGLSQSVSSVNPPTEYKTVQTQAPSQSFNTESAERVPSSYEAETVSTKSPYSYNQYDTSYEVQNQTTSTTTTTRRSPLRSKGRPRYTTTRTDSSNESTTRAAVTRRPLRERRPLPTRSRYEPNKITTEKATKKPIDSNESTTKYTRSRTRGRVHFKPSESGEYNKVKENKNSKEADLAYQRDILHQNYPVTLMERTSTVDIEAITEPSPKISSTKTLDATEYYDTEHAYSYDRASISQQVPESASKEDIQSYTTQTDVQTATYVPKLPSSEEYSYQSRSSLAPVEAISSFGETSPEIAEEFAKKTTPIQKNESQETQTESTEITSTNIASEPIKYSNNDFSAARYEEVTVSPDIEITKEASNEENRGEDAEENIVQTTPSYNRVRVRPGVIRQYHQASSTESSRTKIDRRRPAQAVTYRPAFDRRRTTMKIEEIEADLKTKQVHTRPEVSERRHPVYRPDPTTEASATSETTTKRGSFRRRRPTYTTVSTEASAKAETTSKRSYDVKSRFRGRRPTEKPTERPEVQETTTSTTRSSQLHSRYSNRPRLSERYNKKPETEDSEDQDSNYSINRPKYVEPEADQWSPKLSTDSFKPYNPNDIADEEKSATTETKLNDEEGQLDIITARNEYDDLLISVTPATNRANKKIPDIPPTLEALVEQSKVTKSDTEDMSTFESMLEEVMKSLEEQDEDEYTSKVMKHKGGEIGEIPPERIISSDDATQRHTTVEQEEITTTVPDAEDTAQNEEEHHKGRRRGFWKKVKVRPITESIEAAESQYYSHTANNVPHTITLTKTVHDKAGKYDRPKHAVTTYKPKFEFIKNMFDNVEDEIPIVDIPKVSKNEVTEKQIVETTEGSIDKETPTESSPGNMDLGTGAPDPTVIDSMYRSTPTEPTPSESSFLDRGDGFNLMDYLFGSTSEDSESSSVLKKDIKDESNTEKAVDFEITTEQAKPKLSTTETTFIPEEITSLPSEESVESVVNKFEIKKVNVTAAVKDVEKITESTEEPKKVETSSVSSFMNPSNVISTSMSTEISHETEICFRGKCIKTSKDIL